MAHWRKKETEFEAMNKMITTQPGIKQAELARQLGVQRSTIARRLPSMPEAGYPLYEDNDEGLHSFDPDQLE